MDVRRVLSHGAAAAAGALAVWLVARNESRAPEPDSPLAARVATLERELEEARRAAPTPVPRLAPAPKDRAEGATVRPPARRVGPDLAREGAPSTAAREGEARDANRSALSGSETVLLRDAMLLEAIARLEAEARPDPEKDLDALTRDVRSSDDATRRAALDRLAQARDRAFLPLLVEAANARERPHNVHALVDAIARTKDRPWSARQATGAPDTPIDGDLGTAWASRREEMGEVWLDLDYEQAVRADVVRIRETLAPGALSRVLAKTPDGAWDVVWEGREFAGDAPRWSEVSLDARRYATSTVRLVLDTDRVPGWNEVDAVELVGDGLRQWAKDARASSSYAD